ncbi:hypothetical protein ACLMJK_004236 [Lecanora helva]
MKLLLLKSSKATQNAKQSIEYGTKIVGGVTPGKDGDHLGLPVLPSVQAAKDQLKPDATAIYVAAPQAASAIKEAIEAEIPLIVAVAEHIPLHDLLRIHSMLRMQSKSRLVGANSPGIISAVGKCRLGFHPLPFFRPGNVAVIAKSGTLSYETVASLTRAGLGQSLVIGVGGDLLPGTDFVDALRFLEDDYDTEGIILIGEIGGRAEEEAAEWIKDYRRRVHRPKSIAALIAGVQAPHSRIMGHAGAIVRSGEKSAKAKIDLMKDVGVPMVHHPSKFGQEMRKLLGRSAGEPSHTSVKGPMSQKRGLHTLRRDETSIELSLKDQRRSIHIPEAQSNGVLNARGIKIAEDENPRSRDYFLEITIDRNSRSPCVVTSYSIGGESPSNHAKSHPFGIDKRIDAATYSSIATELNCSKESFATLTQILSTLIDVFFSKEAFSLTTRISRNAEGHLSIARSHFIFDDAAIKSGGRQTDIEKMRDVRGEIPQEVEAEKDGIVYIKLKGGGDIGTLVNGAGLAMNTVDAITDLGGKCANFLDTGGKATSETVKRSFELILQDPDVRTIFVNIFGGLTLCDMIASGVLLAYKDLGIKVPVVVRLRGTNEAIGQNMIAESRLPLYAFDDFDEAASKVIYLARSSLSTQ